MEMVRVRPTDSPLSATLINKHSNICPDMRQEAEGSGGQRGGREGYQTGQNSSRRGSLRAK